MRAALRIGTTAAVLLLSLFYLPTPGSATEMETVLITTQGWEPYTKEENGIQSGSAVEALDCVFTKMGQPYTVLFMPWIRAQSEVREKRAHAFFPASHNNDRDKFARLSDGIVSVKWVWYLPRDSKLDPKDPNFKKTALVTTEAGSNHANWLEKQGYNLTPQPDTHKQLAQMLQRKRIDAILVSKSVFLKGIEGLDFSIDLYREVLEFDDPLGVYFSKEFLRKRPNFLKEFNTQVPGCRQY